jgi:hypothetical protein
VLEVVLVIKMGVRLVTSVTLATSNSGVTKTIENWLAVS